MKKAKKASHKKVRSTPGTQILGYVHLDYVQFNVPEGLVTDVAGALSQVLLSDYHRQFCSPESGDAS